MESLPMFSLGVGYCHVLLGNIVGVVTLVADSSS